MQSTILPKTASFLGVKPTVSRPHRLAGPSRGPMVVRAGAYDEELIKTAVSALVSWLCGITPTLTFIYTKLKLPVAQNTIASKGRGILAMDESNATCGKRLDSIGVENTEPNRRAYRELLITTPGLGEYISGAILFEETLYQSSKDGTSFVDLLNKQNIVPGMLQQMCDISAFV